MMTLTTQKAKEISEAFKVRKTKSGAKERKMALSRIEEKLCCFDRIFGKIKGERE